MSISPLPLLSKMLIAPFWMVEFCICSKMQE